MRDNRCRTAMGRLWEHIRKHNDFVEHWSLPRIGVVAAFILAIVIAAMLIGGFITAVRQESLSRALMHAADNNDATAVESLLRRGAKADIWLPIQTDTLPPSR